MAVAVRERDPFSHLPPGTPVYRLLKDCFMEDDTLHPEDEEIAYVGTPNEWMEPLNEPARVKMTAYLEYLDDCQRAVDAKAGREFTGRLTDLGDILARVRGDTKAEVEQEARKAVVMPARTGPIPSRGDTKMGQAAKKANSGILATKAPKQSRARQLGPTEVIGITNRSANPGSEPGNT